MLNLSWAKCHDIAEIVLMLMLNTNQSISQSINQDIASKLHLLSTVITSDF
jgi:hypothetical protein